jgi:flagellar biosynthesis protein FliQ
MTPEFIVGLAQETIKVTLFLSGPMLGLGLIVGLLISVFQAVTQIQEMTLTFVPKIVAVLIGLLIFLPWLISVMVDFARGIFLNIPTYIR